MVAKCANPKCATPLRYLHQGRLFVIWPRRAAIALQGRIDYRWLCASCCRSMTINDNGQLVMFGAGGFRQHGASRSA